MTKAYGSGGAQEKSEELWELTCEPLAASNPGKARDASGGKEDLLRAALECMAGGVLVIDESGKVAFTNTRFSEIWCVPPELLSTGDGDGLLQYILDQLEDPERFPAGATGSLHRTSEEQTGSALDKGQGLMILSFITSA